MLASTNVVMTTAREDAAVRRVLSAGYFHFLCFFGLCFAEDCWSVCLFVSMIAAGDMDEFS